MTCVYWDPKSRITILEVALGVLGVLMDSGALESLEDVAGDFLTAVFTIFLDRVGISIGKEKGVVWVLGWALGLLEVIPKLATHVALHHLFVVQLPFTFKPLYGCVGDIIGITLSRGATGQTEGGDYYKDGGKKNSEKIHPATLKDPIQKAIREAGSTTRRGWDIGHREWGG
jgi:hypothetical protein